MGPLYLSNWRPFNKCFVWNSTDGNRHNKCTFTLNQKQLCINGLCKNEKITNHSARKTTMLALNSSGLQHVKLKTSQVTALNVVWVDTILAMRITCLSCHQPYANHQYYHQKFHRQIASNGIVWNSIKCWIFHNSTSSATEQQNLFLLNKLEQYLFM